MLIKTVYSSSLTGSLLDSGYVGSTLRVGHVFNQSRHLFLTCLSPHLLRSPAHSAIYRSSAFRSASLLQHGRPHTQPREATLELE